MNKILIKIIIGIVIIYVLIITITSKQKETYTEIDGINYAILVDGQSSNTFPNGNYKANVDCINAKGYWNSIHRKVIIKEISGQVTCYIEFTSITNDDYLNNYVISLENDDNQGDGTVIHETVDEYTTVDSITTTEAGYRYEGKNPNNYIWFNNELWRIIGVFGPERHGQAGKQLVKIIRYNSIGVYAQGQGSNLSNWGSSLLKTLLDGAYYNHTTDTENCIIGINNSAGLLSTTCDFTKTGIQSGYQSMIENVHWYLCLDSSQVVGRLYSAPLVYKSEMKYSTISGKIALIDVSDYLYGVKASDCPRTTNGSKNYNTTNCAGKNWLYVGDVWTVNYFSNSGRREETSIDSEGNLTLPSDSPSVETPLSTRPVLYLSSSVYKISGTGTQADPYIIGLASS